MGPKAEMKILVGARPTPRSSLPGRSASGKLLPRKCPDRSLVPTKTICSRCIGNLYWIFRAKITILASASRYSMNRGASWAREGTAAMKILAAALTIGLTLSATARAAEGPSHGLWVWKSAVVLAAPRGPEKLGEFCRSAGITEVYVSVHPHLTQPEERELAQLVGLLHGSKIRVEALVSSIDADESGSPRGKLMDHVHSILE